MFSSARPSAMSDSTSAGRSVSSPTNYLGICITRSATAPRSTPLAICRDLHLGLQQRGAVIEGQYADAEASSRSADDRVEELYLLCTTLAAGLSEA